MNKTAIEWTDFTWNPVTGCRNTCSYCYARRMTRRFPDAFGGDFEPRLHQTRLDEPLRRKKPARIFVCSMADLFASWLPARWTGSVLQAEHDAPWHTYQHLTKFPHQLLKWYFTKNAWVGVTVTRQRELGPALRVLEYMSGHGQGVRFISFEPMLEPIELPHFALPIEWAIIGGLTGMRWNASDFVSPVRDLVLGLRERGIPVFEKPNLRAAQYKYFREFPEVRHGRKSASNGRDSEEN